MKTTIKNKLQENLAPLNKNIKEKNYRNELQSSCMNRQIYQNKSSIFQMLN